MHMSSTNGHVLRRAGPPGDDRKYDPRYAAHARMVLATWVEGLEGGQSEAARRLGVRQGTISRALQQDAQPSLRILIALHRVTGQSLDRILGLDLDPSPPLPAITDRA